MGHFVPALNGSCSGPPMGRDLGPNPARYNGSCRPGTKLFRAVPCLGRAFFPCFGPAHQARPKCTPILPPVPAPAGHGGSPWRARSRPAFPRGLVARPRPAVRRDLGSLHRPARPRPPPASRLGPSSWRPGAAPPSPGVPVWPCPPPASPTPSPSSLWRPGAAPARRRAAVAPPSPATPHSPPARPRRVAPRGPAPVAHRRGGPRPRPARRGALLAQLARLWRDPVRRPWRLGPARLGVPRPCAARPQPGSASARAVVVPLRSAVRALLGPGVCATRSRHVSAALRVRARVAHGALARLGVPSARRIVAPYRVRDALAYHLDASV
jgi:hypothetical protein